MIFFCAMMICGCSGSTSGGPKVFRYQLLVGAISAEVRRLQRPNVVFTPKFQGRPAGDDVIELGHRLLHDVLPDARDRCGRAGAARADPVTAISGAAGCLSNVGPGLGGIIGPSGNYATLSDPVKWVMSFLMLVGRLEVLTVYVLLTAAFWRA